MQRRHQKVIEEASAPNLDAAALDALAASLAAALQKLGYDNIGTMEMLRGKDGKFGFLEMNTRLQVEHAVTEELTGVDLVAAQIRAAAGERIGDIFTAPIARRGHAIEARIYAEDPKTFFPSPGKLAVFRPPALPGARIETGYAEGNDVTPHYDPMIAKVIARGATRAQAIDVLHEALSAFAITGVKTNIAFLLYALRAPAFVAGEVHTGLVAELSRQFRAGTASPPREIPSHG
jgi:acetyl-CoA carboxylase biotin carboxylase subunit